MVSPSSGFQGPAVSLHYCCLVRYIPGRGSHPAVLEGSRPHPPATVTAVSLGFPRGVALHGTAVLADGSCHRTLSPGWCSNRFHRCVGAVRWGWLNPA